MRRNLLPDFLYSPTWISLLDKVDDAFRTTVDQPSTGLRHLRETTILSEESKAAFQQFQLSDESSLDTFDKPTLVLQANLRGFTLENPDSMTTAQYQRLNRLIASYWYSKGTPRLDKFLSYVFNSTISIEQLWTKDYRNFFSIDEVPVSDFREVTLGGDWYPTSHVRISYDPSVLTQVSLENLLNLVYELGPYTLVVHAVSVDSSIPVVTSVETDIDLKDFEVNGSQVVALGASSLVEATFASDNPLE